MGFTCEICGRKFERCCPSHLKTHGIANVVEYQEYLRKKTSPPPPKDLVSMVANMILKGEEVPVPYLESLDRLQRAVVDRTNALMDIATVRRMNRLGRLLDAMDETDKLLTDPTMVAQLTFPDLLKLSEHLRVHSKEIYDEAKLPEDHGKGNGKSVVNVNTLVQTGNGNGTVPVAPIQLPTDPRERNSLLLKVQKLLSAASGNEGNGKLLEVG